MLKEFLGVDDGDHLTYSIPYQFQVDYCTHNTEVELFHNGYTFRIPKQSYFLTMIQIMYKLYKFY